MSQQPCLPVAICTKRKRQDEDDTNSNRIAFDQVDEMNASDYLQKVAQEARTISNEALIASQQLSSIGVTRKSSSALIIDGSAASMQYLLSHHTQIAPPPLRARPPHETAWIQQTLHQFTRLREYLSECLERGVGGKEHRLLTAVPPMKDAAGWIEFCTGMAADSDDEEETNNHNAAWREALPTPQGYHLPSVQLLCQLDQVMIRRVLAHVVEAMTRASPSSQQLYRWLYALMARLETPVHGQDAATLRKLVVTVAARRANDQNTEVASMNLVLVVAGLFFGQASYSELFPTTL